MGKLLTKLPGFNLNADGRGVYKPGAVKPEEVAAAVSDVLSEDRYVRAAPKPQPEPSPLPHPQP